MKKIILSAIIFAMLITPALKAQVTVGTQEAPVPGALLQLKTIVDATSKGDVNATKGLNFPRVALVKQKQLQPMYSAADAANLSTAVKLAHKGLVVYNLTDNPGENLSVGLNYWDGEQWNSLEQKATQAVFTITDCTACTANGDYFNTNPLNSNNYMTVPVNVTKPGYYTITAVPTPTNGYYFTASGQFMATGPATLTLPGAGQPVNFTPAGKAGDPIVVVLNGDTASCTPYVFVQDGTHKPYFAMACNSTQVFGVYKKGVAVTAANYITMRINVYDGAQGALWSAHTDMIDGLQFEGSGVLGAAGTQTITLYAKGIPMNTATKNFTITTNSQSTTATCNATVTPVISAKRIMAAGSTTYGLTSGGTDGCGAMINDAMNYGGNENSIVKYEGFSTVQTATSLSNLSSWTTGATAYDIIVITYNLTPTAAQRAVLVDYVNRGGVLIYLDQGADALNTQVVGDMFGETISNPVNIANTCNQVIKMNAGVNDEISNGPFGDVRNGQWGEDFANSCGLPIVPRGAIVYASAINASTGVASTSGAQATIIRHPTKNFFWCGDSGLIHGGTSTDNTTTPFWIGARVLNGVNYPNYPVDKPNYGSQAAANRLPVCNSTLFANVMAWAVKMAEENGINSGK